MFVIFAALAAIWGLVIYRAGSQSLRVHYLMGVLLVAKDTHTAELGWHVSFDTGQRTPRGLERRVLPVHLLEGPSVLHGNHEKTWLV